MRLSSRHALIVSLSALGLTATAACSDDETQTDDDTTTTTSGMGGDGGMTTTTSAMGGMTGTGGDVGGAGGVGGAGVGGAGGAGGMGGGGMGGAGGAGGGAMGSQAAYYWGDFDTNNTYEAALLAFPPGTAVKLVPMGITVIDDVFDVAPSPDGTQVAIALEADGNPAQILVMNADGTGMPVMAADLAGAPNTTALEISDLAWSPDGASIAFTADYSLNSHNTVYVVPADGTGTTPQLVSQVAGSADQDAYNVVWVDNTHVAYQADLVVAEVDNLYVSDVTLTTPAPVPLIPENLVSDGAEVESGAEVDASGKVYFRSTHEGGFYLYRADANGANLEQLASAAALMKNGVQAEVGSFAISPDGTQIAFTADAPTADLYQLYVAPVNGATATLQSNVTTAAPAAGDFLGTDTFAENPLSWSPDGMWLAIAADWPVNVTDEDNDYAAFIVPATGAPGGVRIANVPSPGGNYDVNSVAFSADGMRLFIQGDLVVNNNTELYSTTDFAADDQDPVTIRVEEVPTNGDIVGIAILP